MNIFLEKFESGWHNISLGISKQEIDELISCLNILKSEEIEHFHISNNYDNDSMIGDIEIFLKEDDEPDNINIL